MASGLILHVECHAKSIVRILPFVFGVFAILMMMVFDLVHASFDRTAMPEPPPFEPSQIEIVIEDKLTESDRELVDRCVADLKEDSELRRQTKGYPHNLSKKPLITKSQKFGTIVRLDYQYSEDQVPGYVLRLICWIDPDSKDTVYAYTRGCIDYEKCPPGFR